MYELVLRVGQLLIEPLSDVLGDELGALAVSVEDADKDSSVEQAIFFEPGMPLPQSAWAHNTVRALFATQAAASEAVTLLLAQDWAADVQVQSLDAVPDVDWVRLTQAQFVPVEITPTFWIVPSWHQAPAAAQRMIRLDPGMAFGTGTHPTTRMCLRWIASHVRPDWRVLDYGCGSGILAIAAALHGAGSIDAVDIDPAAVESTRANAVANNAVVRAGPPETAAGTYDLVVSNILAQPLKLLAPLLAAHLGSGSTLVLAGLLARQVDELCAVYAPWCKLAASASDDGWVLLTGRRGAAL